jgi:hypothetical protein
MGLPVLTRQRFLRRAAAIAAAPWLVQGCTSDAAESPYTAAVRSTWHPPTGPLTESAAIRRELVRCATLAPSSHNTQCWRYRVEAQAITVLPDLSRRCPAVDPDDHHLHVSLGCAAENLAQAALAHGLKAEAEAHTDSAPPQGIRMHLAPTRARASPLFLAIPERQCTRGAFDGKPLSNTELALLERAGSGEGVQVLLFTARHTMETILAHVVEGNSTQMRDPAFIAELKHWIRFGEDEAVRTGDGLFSATSGNPAVPRWLGSPLFGMFFRETTENDRYAAQVRSSAGIAVFVSEADDPRHWIEAGRCYERFALQATALGVRNAMLNQPVEVAATRPRFASALGIAQGRPDLVVRFGRGQPMPRSLRRPVAAVLV